MFGCRGLFDVGQSGRRNPLLGDLIGQCDQLRKSLHVFDLPRILTVMYVGMAAHCGRLCLVIWLAMALRISLYATKVSTTDTIGACDRM